MLGKVGPLQEEDKNYSTRLEPFWIFSAEGDPQHPLVPVELAQVVIVKGPTV